jgi:hypothetical protein
MSAECTVKLKVQHLYTVTNWKIKKAEIYILINEIPYRIVLKGDETYLERCK